MAEKKYIDSERAADMIYEMISFNAAMAPDWTAEQKDLVKSTARICADYVRYSVPAADVRKVVQGKPVPHYEIWLNSDGEPVQTVRLGLQCPFCGDTGIKKYCPNCGAEIIDEKEGERNVDTAHLDRR